jgi:type I restriction enzyme, R subunit
MARHSDSETALELAALDVFRSLGWECRDCYGEFDLGKSFLGRDNKGEVILLERLRPALKKFNHGIPDNAIDMAIEELSRDRLLLGMAEANREVYRLLRDGVKVRYPDPKIEGEIDATVHVIDWNAPRQNDFFVAQQF